MLSILAGSYAPAAAAGIRRFLFDPLRGEFGAAAGRGGVPFPAYLARSAATGCYYAVGETTSRPAAGPGTSTAQAGQPGTIWALGPDPASPGRWPARALPAGGELPTHIAVHPSGRWLAVSNYGNRPSPGSISIVRLRRDGSLAGIAGRREHAGTGSSPPISTCRRIAAAPTCPTGAR